MKYSIVEDLDISLEEIQRREFDEFSRKYPQYVKANLGTDVSELFLSAAYYSDAHKNVTP